MKLLELEIWNVRGLPHLKLTPNGQNLLVWGPNGCGKSAVVDAIDFLLTGKISRLTGQGTAGLSLAKHGPHVDHKSSEAQVRAIIMLSDGVTKVELLRQMSAPQVLKFDPKLTLSIGPILAVAGQGQHVLTRRDILKYVTAESSGRAQEIQNLLNISDIEDIRKALVKAANDAEKGLQSAESIERTAQAAACATAQLKTYDTSAVLAFVNGNRAILKGNTLSRLHSSVLMGNISPVQSSDEFKPVNITLLARDIQGVLDQVSSHQQKSSEVLLQDLITKVSAIRSETIALRAFSCLKLVTLGIDLLDDSGSCPLCETKWDPKTLRDHLERRLAAAQSVKEQKERITELITQLAAPINTAMAGIKAVTTVARLLSLEKEALALEAKAARLKSLLQIIEQPFENFDGLANAQSDLCQTLSTEGIGDSLESVHTAASTTSLKPTPEQTARDALTRLEENLKAIEKAQAGREMAALVRDRAVSLHCDFISARDTVLQRLYDSIRDRFVALYRQLHDNDETVFSAKIVPVGAGLDFQVDFYGRGLNPPHALHSEGHQDSMGLCLYMALSERLTRGLISLTVLDDVVMSVDSDHRHQLCNMLTTAFPERQFLITTHDGTWARQLQHIGVVQKEMVYKLRNWTVASGPAVDCGHNLWDQIEKDMRDIAIPSAAQKLRWGSEQFFDQVCEDLQVPIVHKIDGKHELGEYLIPAMSRYKELLGKALKAAKSWGNSELEQDLIEKESIRSEVFRRIATEQWGTNLNVHYNNWANFTPNDFRPVVEAFADLQGLFRCNNCQSPLTLAMVDAKPVSVKCRCGKVNWNLVAKG